MCIMFIQIFNYIGQLLIFSNLKKKRITKKLFISDCIVMHISYKTDITV